MRRDALVMFDDAVQAVDARQCIHRFVSLDGGTLRIDDRTYDLDRYERVLVIGAGKASVPMAGALTSILGDRVSQGVVNTKRGADLEALERIEIHECGHPVPDHAGVRGATAMLNLLEGADERTLVLFLISGGGSALTPAPVGGITLEQKQATTQALLECGANIVELNTIRKHLSRVKGGGLARAAFPAHVVALVLSDVIGDPLDVIASGPTVPDTSTWRHCVGILDKYAIGDKLPEPVRRRFEKGIQGDLPDTPKPGDAALAACHNVIVAGNRHAVEAARDRARALGYHPLILSTRVEGEAREVARVFTAIAREIRDAGRPVPTPACVIVGGETTVTIRGAGLGGRNQELALAGAIDMPGLDGVVLMSAGTDGDDGPTDAAGAVVDGATVARAAAANLSPIDHLQRNDAYPLLDATGDLIKTGQTGTNVADVALILVGA
ncbi:MAG: glycerate kinase [Phycisphaeraceae bacterium]|nr:glycerate kinase [Phycisphaeraceae bacterium]